jgi:GTP-binding protein HflX
MASSMETPDSPQPPQTPDDEAEVVESGRGRGHDLSQDPDLPRRAVLCAVHLPEVSEVDFRESLGELRRLGKTLGLQVEGEVTQRRSSFDPGAYLGPGKLTELTTLVGTGPATIVLVDHEISPSQARNIEKTTGAAAVLDRTAVILEIFHRHAKSRQARLQVEIVRLQYMAPRLRESPRGKDRQRGGIGGKGAGESALELDRRKLRDRISQLRKELEALSAERVTQRARRQGLRRVALCGYTNAGKSTLFGALTGSDAYIADKLFATLDTTVRALQPEVKPRILMSDTIGFIRNLPTQLVASFKSTLDEALEASLILHVVDSADPACAQHMATTNEVLREIGAGDVPQIVVFNKVDKLPGGEVPAALREQVPDAMALSARNPQDVARLRQAVIDFFGRELTEVELLVPYDRQALRGQLFAEGQVVAEHPEEEGIRFTVRAEPQVLARLRQALGQGQGQARE